MLTARGITKIYGRVTALDHANIALERGTFHALLGENGAGKSTLAKCIAGIVRPESGTIEIDGTVRQIANPKDAHRYGIGMVHQHFSLAPNLTVAENLVIARPSGQAVIDWRSELRDLRRFCDRMPFSVDLDATTVSLAAGEKQKVEILKQLYLGHEFLILDEPTSVLTIDESDLLFGFLSNLVRSDGLTALLITHKMREVFKFVERVTVLRRGCVVGDAPTGDLDGERLAALMVGEERTVPPLERASLTVGETVLETQDLSVLNDRGLRGVSDMDIAVRCGEIFGIAGVSGNGQRELLEALAGQRPLDRGQIRLHGEPYRATRPQMMRHRIRFLPEEPLHNASVGAMSLAENLALRDFDQPPIANRLGILDRNAIRSQARSLVANYGVRAASIEMPIRELSGGNVQRSVLARELSGEVDILVASNPCFGLDIGAVSEIHARIIDARNRGAAVLLISEDLDELLALSDRIAVMFEGRIVHEIGRDEADARTIGRYMTGHGVAA